MSRVKMGDETIASRPFQHCPVCRHEVVEQINLRLSQGDSFQEVARVYGLSAVAVSRHVRLEHDKPTSQERRDLQMLHDDDLEAKAHACLEEFSAVIRNERDAKACPLCKRGMGNETVLRAGEKVLKAIETLGKLTGKIAPESENKVLVLIGAESVKQARDAVQLVKSGSELSMRDGFDDACQMLRDALLEHPEWRQDALRACGLKQLDEPHTNGVH